MDDDLAGVRRARRSRAAGRGCSSACIYLSGDVSQRDVYDRIAARAAELDDARTRPTGNHLFYLATAPTLFGTVVQHLGAVGLAPRPTARWRRVIIEKPFGRDLESARELNQQLAKVLGERQTYRIDHYLGKETVQNIMAFRFGNGIFEPVWNRRYIDHVQITASEEVGVELRGGYYDESGAMRDMVPNHLFQLISLTAMEPPTSFDANAVRDEQTKVLRAIAPYTPEEVLRAIGPRPVRRGHRQEERIATPTAASRTCRRRRPPRRLSR